VDGTLYFMGTLGTLGTDVLKAAIFLALSPCLTVPSGFFRVGTPGTDVYTDVYILLFPVAFY
jgi:hypothetical protein